MFEDLQKALKQRERLNQALEENEAWIIVLRETMSPSFSDKQGA